MRYISEMSLEVFNWWEETAPVGCGKMAGQWRHSSVVDWRELPLHPTMVRWRGNGAAGDIQR